MDDDLVTRLRVIDVVVLGKRIRALRLERGLLQGELAEGVVSAPYISRIENGQRRPEPEVLEGLAAKLGVAAADLLGTDPAAADARPLRDRIRLELDYAELEVATGSAAAALERLQALPETKDKDLLQHAEFLHLIATRAVGGDAGAAVSGLEDLVAEDLSSSELWLRAKLHLCRALREAGEYEAAISTGNEALKKLDDLDLTGSDVAVQLAVTVAGVYEAQGEVDRALRLTRRTLEAADGSATPKAQAYVHWNASICESDRGNTTAALEHAKQAIVLLGADGNARHLAILRSNLGALLLETHPPEAGEALELLDRARVELGATEASANELAASAIEHARALYLLGRRDEALAELAELVGARDRLSPLIAASALVLRGEMLMEVSPSDAADQIRDAAATLASLGQDRALARLWFQVGAKFEALGDASGALDAFRRGGVAAGVMPVHTAANALT